MVFVIQKFVVFRFILPLPITKFRWQPLCYKQNPAFTQKFQKKVSLFLHLHMKNSLFVKTTVSPITTKRRVFLPACKYHIVLLGNVQELLKNWIHFALPINTSTVFIHYSSIESVENLLQKVVQCLITCNEQLTLITETGQWTECRALQKRDS